MNSVQSGLDSSEASEDEGSSEIGFGQAEEEVGVVFHFYHKSSSNLMYDLRSLAT